MVPGGVVRSKTGRDAGKDFIVVKMQEDRFVRISDGVARRVENPKKKNIKHLAFDGTIIDILNGKFTNNMKVTNADIRNALESYRESKGKSFGNDAEG
jgi:large subunit ribosomal protein L14e